MKTMQVHATLPLLEALHTTTLWPGAGKALFIPCVNNRVYVYDIGHRKVGELTKQQLGKFLTWQQSALFVGFCAPGELLVVDCLRKNAMMKLPPMLRCSRFGAGR